MQLKIEPQNAENTTQCFLSHLSAEDVPLLEALENTVSLSFWGTDNYLRFLKEYPEYFGGKVVQIAEDNQEQLLGFFLARAIFDNLELLKIGICPEFQRRGIGTQLMEALYAEGIHRGCNRCFLEVRKSNQKAIQFYNSHNFRIAGTRLNYYSDPVEDAWVMERTL
jgi:[ribosomal protein S18]-alanine N-acetyltransferase